MLRRPTRTLLWQPDSYEPAASVGEVMIVATKADLQELKADMYKAMVSQTFILLGFVFTMLKFM